MKSTSGPAPLPAAPLRREVVLIGDPVEGSPSPAIHNAAFAQAGLDLEYSALSVGLDELPRMFAGLRDRARGLNVTRPLKEAVVPFLDRWTEDVARAGSANTIIFEDGEATGASTDGPGFLAALSRVRLDPIRRAVILGTGGAARAVAWALMSGGASVVVTGRNELAGRRLVAHLLASSASAGAAVGAPSFLPSEPGALAGSMDGADLLVNATPVGGSPDGEDSPLPRGVALPPGLTVADLVYRPRRTRLLQLAERSGCAVMEGMEMLVEQAALSWSMWTGRRAPVEVMREAAYRALDVSPRDEGPAEEGWRPAS